MPAELGGSQLSSLLEALPRIARVLPSPPADAPLQTIPAVDPPCSSAAAAPGPALAAAPTPFPAPGGPFSPTRCPPPRFCGAATVPRPAACSTCSIAATISASPRAAPSATDSTPRTFAWPAAIVAVTSSTWVRITAVVAATSAAALADSSASWRTSSATTANPFPCSPARAASIAAFSANRFVWEEIRLISSTKSSIAALCCASCCTCVDVVCTTSRTESSALPAASTSPRCRSATVRISSPSCATRPVASAISPAAFWSRSRPVPIAFSSLRCSSAPPYISTMAVHTPAPEAADCPLTPDRPPGDPASASDSPDTSPTIPRTRPLSVARGEIANQSGEIARLVAHGLRPAQRLAIAAQILERVRDGIVDLDRGLEPFDAVDRQAVLEGEPLELLQRLLVAKPLVGRELEFPARVIRRLAEILLGGPDLIEHRAHEPAADEAGGLQRLELLRHRRPHGPQRRGPDDRRHDQSGQHPAEAQENAPAQGLQRSSSHRTDSGSSSPCRITPMTTGLAGTAPFLSKAIMPVTPSNAGLVVPT